MKRLFLFAGNLNHRVGNVVKGWSSRLMKAHFEPTIQPSWFYPAHKKSCNNPDLLQNKPHIGKTNEK